MSNRRKPRQQRRAERDARPPIEEQQADEHPLEGKMPWIWAIRDADEAERRGDAAGALTVVERRLLDPDGKVFWRRSRMCGLRQVAELAPHLPAWVWSRWILAQASQHLDEVDGGARARRASQVATDLHEEWTLAPMGGYHYLGPVEDRLLWHDHATGESLETLDIGSGTRLLGGADVIGRVVPVEGSSAAQLAAAALDLAACELERETRLRASYDEDGFVQEDDEWDGWAHVHAALVMPEVVTGQTEEVRPDDAELLAGIHERVAEPARSIIGSLLERARAAA